MNHAERAESFANTVLKCLGPVLGKDTASALDALIRFHVATELDRE